MQPGADLPSPGAPSASFWLLASATQRPGLGLGGPFEVMLVVGTAEPPAPVARRGCKRLLGVRRGLGHCVSSSCEAEDVDVMLASETGKKKLVSRLNAWLSPGREATESGLHIASCWDNPPLTPFLP